MKTATGRNELPEAYTSGCPSKTTDGQAPGHPDGRYDIRGFGAKPDNEAPATTAIQAAIDACHASGGGTVAIPAGTFVSGTIWLKSHVHLHLAPGAVLQGSTDPAQYCADDAFPQNRAVPREVVSGAHLIVALEAVNVSISGPGTIDGNGLHFFRDNGKPKLDRGPWRPGQMVFFCECEHVTVRDLVLRNSPFWNLLILGCRNVVADGLDIANDRRGREGDGIDIDCSQNVRISNCAIDTCDDCITLRADVDRLRLGPRPCEDICITNCVLRSAANAFRIGVGNGEIRRAAVSNVVVRDTRYGIGFTSNYVPRHQGVDIHDLTFANMIVDAEAPFAVATGLGHKPIHRLRFNHCMVRAGAPSFLSGCETAAVHDVWFHDIDYVIHGGADNTPEARTPLERWRANGVAFYHGADGMPCGFLLDHAEDVRFSDVRIRWEAPTGLWRHALDVRGCRDIDCRGLTVASDTPDGFREAIRLADDTERIALPSA